MDKFFLYSKTIQGVLGMLGAIVALVAPSLGFDWGQGDTDSIVAIWAGVIGVVSGGWAWYGRRKADGGLKLTP